METILPISLKLYFTANTLGCYELSTVFLLTPKHAKTNDSNLIQKKTKHLFKRVLTCCENNTVLERTVYG